MRLASLRIENFRSCHDVLITFDPYTTLVGPNGAGKSTILAALNILFRNVAGSPTNVTTLAEEDFCDRDVTRPIKIAATFTNLTQEEKEAFKSYVRQDM